MVYRLSQFFDLAERLSICTAIPKLLNLIIRSMWWIGMLVTCLNLQFDTSRCIRKKNDWCVDLLSASRILEQSIWHHNVICIFIHSIHPNLQTQSWMIALWMTIFLIAFVIYSIEFFLGLLFCFTKISIYYYFIITLP